MQAVRPFWEGAVEYDTTRRDPIAEAFEIFYPIVQVLEHLQAGKRKNKICPRDITLTE